MNWLTRICRWRFTSQWQLCARNLLITSRCCYHALLTKSMFITIGILCWTLLTRYVLRRVFRLIILLNTNGTMTRILAVALKLWCSVLIRNMEIKAANCWPVNHITVSMYMLSKNAKCLIFHVVTLKDLIQTFKAISLCLLLFSIISYHKHICKVP